MLSPQPPVLRRVINAWGTATPFGVSRSASPVADAISAMLQRHVVVAELQAEAGRVLVEWSGAEAGCVTHCTAAAITLSVAACMAGSEAARIAQLPDASGMKRKVIMLASQQVNYGQPIAQAVRLAGAEAVACNSIEDVDEVLSQGGVAGLLAVESHLAAGSGPVSTQGLVDVARAHGVPLVLDAAAQDWRVRELVGGGADLVLVSAQKYLGAPTAGLVLGRSALVAAVDAQHGGIGRAMKPTKEALAGVIAAVQLRQQADLPAWRSELARKVDAVSDAASRWPGVTIAREADPQGNGFERLWLTLDRKVLGRDAATVIRALRDGDPVVAVAPHRVAQNCIGLELTGVASADIAQLCSLLAAALH